MRVGKSRLCYATRGIDEFRHAGPTEDQKIPTLRLIALTDAKNGERPNSRFGAHDLIELELFCYY